MPRHRLQGHRVLRSVGGPGVLVPKGSWLWCALMGELAARRHLQTSPRRPPAALLLPTRSEVKSAAMKSVPKVCQRIAKLGVLAELATQRTSNLRVFKAGRGTDSVPGHHFKSIT